MTKCNFNSYQASCGPCTFEPRDPLEASCGYKDSSTGAFKWENIQASTMTSPPPFVDHTTNSSSGHYMYVDHSDNLYGDTALLKGPQLGKTKSLCTLRLWYFIAGTRSQKFVVYSMVSHANVCLAFITLSLLRRQRRTRM